jgi:hypothetical protein
LFAGRVPPSCQESAKTRVVERCAEVVDGLPGGDAQILGDVDRAQVERLGSFVDGPKEIVDVSPFVAEGDREALHLSEMLLSPLDATVGAQVAVRLHRTECPGAV